MTISYIVAENLNHAYTTATVDWGWRAVARDVFETPWGERVRYASDGQLRGRRGRLYRGWGWQTRRDASEIWFLLDDDPRRLWERGNPYKPPTS